MPKYAVQSLEYCEEFAACDGEGAGTRYQTLHDYTERSHSCHGSALFALAASNRMATVYALEHEYAQSKARYYLDHGKHGPAFGLAKRMLNADLSRLVLNGIFETGLQLNLQISLLAMTALEQKQDMHDEALGFRFGITVVSKTMLFSIVVGSLNSAILAKKNISTVLWAIGVLQEFRGKPELRQILLWKVRFLIFALLIHILIGCNNLLKLIAVFKCKQCLWNVSGCAVIEPSCFQDGP